MATRRAIDGSRRRHFARANPSDGGGAFRFSPDAGNCSKGGGAPNRRIFETTDSRDAYCNSWTKPSDPAKNNRPSLVEADAVNVVSFEAENSVGTTRNLPLGSLYDFSKTKATRATSLAVAMARTYLTASTNTLGLGGAKQTHVTRSDRPSYTETSSPRL